jgi:hypothetical protein
MEVYANELVSSSQEAEKCIKTLPNNMGAPTDPNKNLHAHLF